MGTIQLIQFSREDLIQDIEKTIYKILSKKDTKQNPSEEKPLYTREETAIILDVSLTTLYLWNKNGILSAKKLGRRVYYSKEDVLAKIQE